MPGSSLQETTILLVERARDGDSGAMDDLIHRFTPYVYRIVSVMVGKPVHASGDLDDLVQESLLKAYTGLEKFGQDGRTKFRAWLRACARSVVLDDWRRWTAHVRDVRKERRFSDFTESGLGHVFRDEEGARPSAFAREKESLIEQGRREEEVIEALLELTEKQRQVILFRHLCELPYEDIARRMELSQASTARVLFHKAMKKLQALLGEAGEA